jgi:hypothetical protein
MAEGMVEQSCSLHGAKKHRGTWEGAWDWRQPKNMPAVTSVLQPGPVQKLLPPPDDAIKL